MKTPIVFIIFNRIESTQVVFEAIRQAKPERLLIIADGPRLDRPGEYQKCQEARSIIKAVDWDCEILTNFSSDNLGCGERIRSGLEWAFSLVEDAIILEDDCFPDPSFFPYCEELLDYYRNDTRITAICGENAQFGREVTPYSYYFSRYFHSWGWATWRRAWKKYDFDMKQWNHVKDSSEFKGLFADTWVENYWRNIFQGVYDKKINTWDYQWIFYSFVQNGLSIIPKRNLISNIGFGEGATHTYDIADKFSKVETKPLEFPLMHNPFVIRNVAADNYEEVTKFHVPGDLKRVKISVKNTLRNMNPFLK